jgi:opacity protein-like surface antigen
MMKNNFLISFLLLVIVSTYAQEDNSSKNKSYFGVRAGVNFLKGSNYDNHSSDLGVGFQVGGLVNLPLGKSNFSFQPEVLYMKVNGSETDVNLVYSNGKLTELNEYSSNIFLVPLNFRYLINNKIGIELGPSLGYRFSGNRNETNTFYEYATGESNVSKFKSKSDGTKFSALINLGVDYSITNKINLGFKYYFSPAGFENSDKIMENSVFSFNLGYNFIK